ncbi:MAG: ABC transporter ATP-binding protein [Pseudomonadota bacterium]
MNPIEEKYLEFSHLTKTYPGAAGPAVIVKDFDFAVSKGEFVCLIGHSGCGKSTVLSIAAGLLEPTEGGVMVDAREIPGPGTDRGVVFQSPCLLPWMTAFGNVMLGVEQARPDAPRKQREEIVAHYLDAVGLGDSMHRKPAELSSGMRQRVGIARAFALDPKVLLLDEPFGMLDSLTRFELQQILVDTWSANRKTALMVTHDVDEALFLSDRIAMMTSGPAARLGEIMQVPFTRPRDRTTVLDHPDYYTYRERLITFLEDQAPSRAVA